MRLQGTNMATRRSASPRPETLALPPYEGVDSWFTPDLSHIHASTAPDWLRSAGQGWRSHRNMARGSALSLSSPKPPWPPTPLYPGTRLCDSAAIASRIARRKRCIAISTDRPVLSRSRTSLSSTPIKTSGAAPGLSFQICGSTHPR